MRRCDVKGSSKLYSNISIDEKVLDGTGMEAAGSSCQKRAATNESMGCSNVLSRTNSTSSFQELRIR